MKTSDHYDLPLPLFNDVSDVGRVSECNNKIFIIDGEAYTVSDFTGSYDMGGCLSFTNTPLEYLPPAELPPSAKS